MDLAATAVYLSSAAVDALRPAWDAANAALVADGQTLIDAVEAAMACETGQGEITQDRSVAESGRKFAVLRRVAKTLRKLARRKA